MNVVFMGTPEFAVPTLEGLVAHHHVLVVVTQPDKQRGRGKQLHYPPVKEAALAHDLTVIQPEKARDEAFIQSIKKLQPDVIVVVAYGQILSEELLNIPTYGCINVHGSLLPKYRGAAPMQWSILDGEEETGITTMMMAKGLDTGDMLDKATLTLDPKETAGSLHDKLMVMGAELLLETLTKIENHTAVPTPQDDSQSTYAKMLSKDMGNIDFNQTAVEIERWIRGLNPWPSAFTTLGGKTLKIWDADVVEGEGNPGTVIGVTKKWIDVATGEGALRLKEIQLAGKKRMNVASFLAGYHVDEGRRLGV